MRTCLYRHYDAADDLLYVGIASSVILRMEGHRASSEWVADIARISVEWFETRSEALEAEREAIQAERPKHNRIRYLKRPPKKPKERKTTCDGGPDESRSTKRDRIARDGRYHHFLGWLTKSQAETAQRWMDANAREVERIASTPGRRGRKPKAEGDER